MISFLLGRPHEKRPEACSGIDSVIEVVPSSVEFQWRLQTPSFNPLGAWAHSWPPRLRQLVGAPSEAGKSGDTIRRNLVSAANRPIPTHCSTCRPERQRLTRVTLAPATDSADSTVRVEASDTRSSPSTSNRSRARVSSKQGQAPTPQAVKALDVTRRGYNAGGLESEGGVLAPGCRFPVLDCYVQSADDELCP